MAKGGVSTAEVQEYLGGLDYPVDKSKLVDYARQRGAPEDVVDILNKIPERKYPTPAEVNQEIGKIE